MADNHRHNYILVKTESLKNGKTRYYYECMERGCNDGFYEER
jgi:hypothetical protein